MPIGSTFVPRIKIPDQYSKLTFKPPKLALNIKSKCLPASMRNNFSNCDEDYLSYDASDPSKQNGNLLPKFW